jgi:hypothetical protein
MKPVVVANFARTVGKATLARHLFDTRSGYVASIASSKVDVMRSAELDAIWAVPCTPSRKAVKETAETLDALVGLGVSGDRIRIIKNKVVHVDQMDDDFEELRESAELHGVRVIDTPMLEMDVYSRLDDKPGTVREYADDESDYKSIAREAEQRGDSGAQAEAVSAAFRRRYARSATRNLDVVLAELMGSLASA